MILKQEDYGCAAVELTRSVTIGARDASLPGGEKLHVLFGPERYGQMEAVLHSRLAEVTLPVRFFFSHRICS